MSVFEQVRAARAAIRVHPAASRLAIATLAVLALACSSPGFSATCGAPIAIDDGWSTAAPVEAGLDDARLCPLGSRLRELVGADAHGVVVIRHGILVYEDYFPGEDARWPQQHWGEAFAILEHDRSALHDVQSITKSVTAILTGIALDRGALKNVDIPIVPLLAGDDPSLSGKERITLRDLLTMRSGLQWPIRPYLAMARQMDAAPDPARFVLEQPLVATPGSRWHYNNGSAELVGAVLQKATGVPLDQFARQALFDLLDIRHWEWGRTANGTPGASWGLRMTPRDLAKLGQLILDHGVWHGRRIVSADWISAMQAPQSGTSANRYGYFWWLGNTTVDDRTIGWIAAIGWGGQYLYIVPTLDLVVVVTAGLYDFEGRAPQGLAGDAALDIAVRAATGR